MPLKKLFFLYDKKKLKIKLMSFFYRKNAQKQGFKYEKKSFLLKKKSKVTIIESFLFYFFLFLF